MATIQERVRSLSTYVGKQFFAVRKDYTDKFAAVTSRIKQGEDNAASLANQIADRTTGLAVDQRIAPVSRAVQDVATGLAVVRDTLSPLPDAVARLQNSINQGYFARATFNELLLLPSLSQSLIYVVPDDDIGKHAGISSEVGYDAGQVPNSGMFNAVGSAPPYTLRRIGGSGAAAVPGLVADNKTLRDTRYIARPADVVKGWTDGINLSPALAPSVVLGATFSVQSGIGGSGLQITGTRNAGPVAQVRIEADKVYAFAIICQRLQNDPASNLLLPRIRAFSAAGTDLGAVAATSRTIIETDLLQILAFTISTKDGSSFKFPDPLGGSSRPYVSMQGSTGRMLINAITMPVEVTDFAASVRNAIRKVILADADLIAGTDAAGVGFAMSWSDLKKQVESYLMPARTYNWPAHKTVGIKPVVVIPQDDGIQEFAMVNTGAYDGVISVGGQQPALDGLGMLPLDAGGGNGTNLMPIGAISAVAKGDTKVTAFFKTTTPYNVAARSAAQLYIDKVASAAGITLTTAMADALRAYYTGLYDSGKIQASGAAFNLVAPGQAKFINLANLDALLAIPFGGVGSEGWRPAVFDGVDDWASSRVRFGQFATPNDWSISAYVMDGTNQGSTRCAAGDGTRSLTPNRTNTTVGARAGSSTLYTPSGFSAGAGLVSISQVENSKLTFRQRKTIVVEAATESTTVFSDRDLLIGARNGAATGGDPVPSSGSFYLGPMAFISFGLHDTAAMHAAVSDLQEAFNTATAGF